MKNNMRRDILIALGFIMLIGFLTIGFFIFPIGITLCASIGLYYGYRKHDKPFIKWSAVALIIGIIFLIYTFCLIGSM